MPSACIAVSVSAVAMPLGKGSCSMLICWRFMGIAMKTPSADTAPAHSESSSQPSVWCTAR